MSPTGNPDESSARHIFVVDDEPMLLDLAQSILVPAGFRVSLFRDPTQAIQALRDATVPPDLLVTDYAMHPIDGLQVIAESRRIVPGLKVLMVSGTVTESIFANGPVQPDRFLAKPYDLLRFRTTVAELAGKARPLA
jgi:CheY-like chemotaxis protein